MFVSRPIRRAFTTMELLVVVAFIAAMAGAAVAVYSRVEGGQVKQPLVNRDLAEIRAALVRFHRDTGFLPGQGPFDHVSNSLANPQAAVVNLPAFVVNAPLDWLHSPANLWMLFENPLTGTSHPLEAWDPVSRRGWNGPYLSRPMLDVVDVPPQWNVPTSAAPIYSVYGVADPYGQEPSGPNNAYFRWYSVTMPNQTKLRGRPYLLLPPGSILGGWSFTEWCLLAAGADGTHGTTDDVLHFIFR